jgi:hypothetical protein
VRARLVIAQWTTASARRVNAAAAAVMLDAAIVIRGAGEPWRRRVACPACISWSIPREHVSDEPDLEEVYNTERHLLYVACTRARDRLLITGVSPGSEFLADLEGHPPTAVSTPSRRQTNQPEAINPAVSDSGEVGKAGSEVLFFISGESHISHIAKGQPGDLLGSRSTGSVRVRS